MVNSRAKLLSISIGIIMMVIGVLTVALVSVQAYETKHETSSDIQSGSDNKGTDTSKCSGKNCYSQFAGATWIEYDVVSDPTVIKPFPSAGLEGRTLQCAKLGADKYYVLSYNRYDKTSSGNNKFLAIQTDGVLANHNLLPFGGVTPFLYGDQVSAWGDKSKDLEEISSKFNEAKDADTVLNGSTWEDAGAFCYSDKWSTCPPDHPDYATGCVPPVIPVTSTSTAYFYATSSVKVPEIDGIPGQTITSASEDKKAFATFSTDNDSVDLEFWHTLYYKTNDPDSNDSEYDKKSYKQDDDRFMDDVSTTWTLSKGGSSSNAGVNTGITPSDHIFTRAKYNDDPQGKPHNEPKEDGNSGDIGKVKVTVKLNPGDRKTVCQRIDYADKNFTYKTNEEKKSGPQVPDVDDPMYGKLDPTTGIIQYPQKDGDPVHDYWKWEVESSSDSSYSEACVEIYRPDDLSPDFNLDPGDAGSMSSDIMYAGESTHLSWDTTGESRSTRQLHDWSAIVWLTTENASQNTVGNRRYRGNGPCAYYGSNTYYCNQDAGGPRGYYVGGYDWDKSETYVVPDHTGSKLCLSFGYYYQYWYAISTDYYITSSLNYIHRQGSSGDYWRIYDASCRTIAKKPSTAIWNGSLMTPGGIKTSLSPRYDITSMNDRESVGGNDELIPTDNGGSRTLYGSWSEYLDVVAQSSVGHSSGSSLAIGSGKIDICDNVDLTIANTDCKQLGNSGINNNSAYLTKLYTYLRDNAKFNDSTSPVRRYVLSDSAEVMAKLGSNMTGTTIIKYTGDTLVIDKDIIYSIGGPYKYNSIHELPQVLIFANKNISITGDVERIDAWLIAGGTIDTCNDVNGTKISDGNGGRDVAATVHGISMIQACSKQLVFNGPVMADRLKLNRTFGSDPLASIGKNYWATFASNGTTSSTKYAPAEIFNLRADTYLWAYAQASRYDSSYTESYSRELPPRY